MSDDNSFQLAGEPLDPVLERAVGLLRESEQVRSEWRAQVLDGVARQSRRRMPVWGWAALSIAAALCFAAGLRSMRGGSFGESTRDGAPASDAVRAVRFAIAAPSARSVSLVGDFDRWNPSAVPMRRESDGQWVVDVHLPPGRHVYAYSVDGGLRDDPSAPRAVEDDFGVPSSVIVVPEQGGE